MIIRAIRAQNFMKFASLDLSAIPEVGVIGIEGPNESGKTTIGEAVLFAFFGKTRSSLETSVSRLIRWGADYLSVEVEFRVPGRGDFLIYREIDKYGTNYVKVIEAAGRTEVAAGNVNVSEFLARTLKFDFFEFHQSFYHDQRHLGTSPESQAAFVERMTGISQIREAVAAIKKDIEQLEREFAHFQKDIQRNLQQMEKYERNAAKLPELRELARNRKDEAERAKGEVRRRQEEAAALHRLGEERLAAAKRLEALVQEPAEGLLAGLAEVRGGLERLSGGSPAEREFAEKEKADIADQVSRLAGIEKMLADFLPLRESFRALGEELRARLDPEAPESVVSRQKDLQAEADRAAGRARGATIAGGLCFLAAIAAAAAVAVTVIEWTNPGIAALNFLEGRETPALIVGGAVFVVTVALTIVFFAMRARAAGRARNFQILWNEEDMRIREDTAERDRLASVLSVSGPGEVIRFAGAAEDIADPRRADLLREFKRGHGPAVDPENEGEYRKVVQSIARMERDLRAKAVREAQRADRAIGEAEAAAKKAHSDLEKGENEIHECESQASKRTVIAEKNRELEARAGGVRKEIDLRRTSIDLLEDAASSIRNKIGPSLSGFLRRVLPPLTSGRYRDVKVGSDLALQVFTGDKGDFLDRSELSGGTQEALSLALRLAASQTFIDSRTRQAQFVFLDEPFKMMDDERALRCLQVLRSISGDIRQFFVIQPAFSAEERAQFDVLIRTAVDLVHLAVPGGPAARNAGAGAETGTASRRPGSGAPSPAASGPGPGSP